MIYQTDLDFSSLRTPCYVVDERLLIKNLEILKSVEDRTGAKVLLYLKTLSLDIAPTLGNVSRKIIPRAEKGVRSLSLSGFSLLVNWHSCPLNDLP